MGVAIVTCTPHAACAVAAVILPVVVWAYVGSLHHQAIVVATHHQGAPTSLPDRILEGRLLGSDQG